MEKTIIGNNNYRVHTKCTCSLKHRKDRHNTWRYSLTLTCTLIRTAQCPPHACPCGCPWLHNYKAHWPKAPGLVNQITTPMAGIYTNHFTHLPSHSGQSSGLNQPRDRQISPRAPPKCLIQYLDLTWGLHPVVVIRIDTYFIFLSVEGKLTGVNGS